MKRLQSLSILIGVAAVSLLLVGCTGGSSDNAASSPDNQQPQMGQQESSQRAPGQGQKQPSRPQAPQMEFSDAQVDAAGRIYAKLQDHQQQMQGEDQSRQEAGQQMRKVMQEAVADESDLSGRQFQQFMQVVKQDAGLRKRFFDAIESAGGQRPQPAPAPRGNQ